MRLMAVVFFAFGLLASVPVHAQSQTSCRWVGDVWTCDQRSTGGGIDWSILNRTSDSAADNFVKGMEIGQQAQRSRLERERLMLEQERLKLERELLGQRKLESSARGSVPAGTQSDYSQKWLEKAKPRMGLYPDFAKVVFEGDVAITPAMVMLMSASNYAADIAYYLGTHKAESLAIAQLPLLEAARAIDAIEAKVKSAAPIEQPAKAPEK